MLSLVYRRRDSFRDLGYLNSMTKIYTHLEIPFVYLPVYPVSQIHLKISMFKIKFIVFPTLLAKTWSSLGISYDS